MSLETIVADLATATEALHTAISDKKTVLDNAAQQAAVSLTTAQGHQTTAQTKVTEAAADGNTPSLFSSHATIQ